MREGGTVGILFLLLALFGEQSAEARWTGRQRRSDLGEASTAHSQATELVICARQATEALLRG